MHLDKSRLRRAVPWQATVVGLALIVFAILTFAYAGDWWGVVLTLLAVIGLVAQAYYYEGRDKAA